MRHFKAAFNDLDLLPKSLSRKDLDNFWWRNIQVLWYRKIYRGPIRPIIDQLEWKLPEMKYYVKKEGLSFTLVVFTGKRVLAKTGIAGQDLGKTIEEFTKGGGEKLDELPQGIKVDNGIISWLANAQST
jgi:hypothetical protein